MEVYYNKPYPTIKDLVKNKDYDFIEYRALFPKIENIDNKRSIHDQSLLLGYFKSYNGVFCSYLYNDEYCPDVNVIYFKEWKDTNKNIKNGITIVGKTN